MARRNSSELIEELFCVLPSSQRENYSSHLYIPYSRKVHRRVYCYGHSAYDLWVQLESDPTVVLFNEQFEDIAFSINEKKFTAKPLFASKSQSEKSAIVTLHFFVPPTADDMEDVQVPATEKEGAMLDWGKQNGIAVKIWQSSSLYKNPIRLENQKRLLRYVCAPERIIPSAAKDLVMAALAQVRKTTVEGLIHSLKNETEDSVIAVVADLILGQQCDSDIDQYPFHYATELSVHHAVIKN